MGAIFGAIGLVVAGLVFAGVAVPTGHLIYLGVTD
jgi:hypothetical protein